MAGTQDIPRTIGGKGKGKGKGKGELERTFVHVSYSPSLILSYWCVREKKQNETVTEKEKESVRERERDANELVDRVQDEVRKISMRSCGVGNDRRAGRGDRSTRKRNKPGCNPSCDA